MLSSVDKLLHGAETGELSKGEVREALDAFFLVGQPGGKTLNRFDEIMQVLPWIPALQLILQRCMKIFQLFTLDYLRFGAWSLIIMHENSRHDLLLHVQALDEDQEGNILVLKKLFEEDREFNQGFCTFSFAFLRRFPLYLLTWLPMHAQHFHHCSMSSLLLCSMRLMCNHVVAVQANLRRRCASSS